MTTTINDILYYNLMPAGRLNKLSSLGNIFSNHMVTFDNRPVGFTEIKFNDWKKPLYLVFFLFDII